MKELYISILMVLLIVVYAQQETIGKQNSKIIRYIRAMMWLETGIVVSNVIGLTVANNTVALFFTAIYCSCLNYLMIPFLFLMEEYTKSFRGRKWVQHAVITLMAADTVSLLINVKTRHMYSVVPYYFVNGTCINTIAVTPVYTLHMALGWFCSGIALGALLRATFRTEGFYKLRFSVPLIFLIVATVTESLLRFSDIPFDISVYVYLLAHILLIYIAYIYLPRRMSKQAVNIVIRDVQDAVICFDVFEECIYANNHMRNLFDPEADFAALGELFKEWAQVEHLRHLDRARWLRTMRISEDELIRFDIRFDQLVDASGKYVGSYFSMYDCTADMEKTMADRRAARHDALTGIYNRETFYEEAKDLLERHPETEYILACSDIKEFKLVNDLFGTTVGDMVLKRVAEIMRLAAVGEDVYGRLGSDKFAIIMPKDRFSEEMFEDYIRSINRAVKDSVYHIHIQMGIYQADDRTLSVSAMCDRAFMAISEIKNQYDTIYAYYDERILDRAVTESNMIKEFDEAMLQRQFKMYLQPQVTPNGVMIGAEALVRWIHPVKGMISPGVFIPVFEKTGMIFKLDKYIWEEACATLHKWKGTSLGTAYISVNISNMDFYYLDIYETLTQLVEEYRLTPDKLKLEITESAVMMDPEAQLSLLERLRDYGFQIEIDDFGSGYSSLNTLKDMNADVLKIDMGFLRETENEERSKSILKTIIALAKDLRMQVVTEGVEKEEQISDLTEMGVDVFQGYYFSKPIPVSEFEEKYSKQVFI